MKLELESNGYNFLEALSLLGLFILSIVSQQFINELLRFVAFVGLSCFVLVSYFLIKIKKEKVSKNA